MTVMSMHENPFKIDISILGKTNFLVLQLNYAGTTLKIPVRITSADHRPAPLQTIL